MKKKILLCVLMTNMSSALFAQSVNARTEVNTIITTIIIPVCALGLLIGFIALCWQNQEGLRGKNGASKQDAWFSVGEGMIFVFIVIAAIGAVAAKLTSMSFSI